MSDNLNQFLSENICFVTKGLGFYCTLCKVNLKTRTTQTLDRHLNSKAHQIKELLIDRSNDQDDSNFNFELCKAFVESGVPLSVVDKTPMINFFQKQFQQKLPCYECLRKNYLTKVYDSTITKIKRKILGHNVYFIIDESRDIYR